MHLVACGLLSYFCKYLENSKITPSTQQKINFLTIFLTTLNIPICPETSIPHHKSRNKMYKKLSAVRKSQHPYIHDTNGKPCRQNILNRTACRKLTISCCRSKIFPKQIWTVCLIVSLRKFMIVIQQYLFRPR